MGNTLWQPIPLIICGQIAAKHNRTCIDILKLPFNVFIVTLKHHLCIYKGGKGMTYKAGLNRA